MKPKILSWNVRGFNERDRNLLGEWKDDIVCLQETKLELVSRTVVRCLWGCQHVDWWYLGLRRAFGWILLM
jgi:hypothetical protein